MKKKKQIEIIESILNNIKSGTWELKNVGMENGIIWDHKSGAYKYDGESSITLHIKNPETEREAKKFLSTAGLI